MAMQIDQDTDMNYMVPTAPCDGTIVMLNPNGLANLLFYQVRKATGEHIDKVDVTGAVVMSLQDLENYRDAITENIENFKNREK
jgi:hypothetical protein